MKEVGIDASFRLIRGMICRGVAEIKRSECGIRIQGRTFERRSSQVCDIMHEITVKKEAAPPQSRYPPVAFPECLSVCGWGHFTCVLIKKERSPISRPDVTAAMPATEQTHSHRATRLIARTASTCNFSHRQAGPLDKLHFYTKLARRN